MKKVLMTFVAMLGCLLVLSGCASDGLNASLDGIKASVAKISDSAAMSEKKDMDKKISEGTMKYDKVPYADVVLHATDKAYVDNGALVYYKNNHKLFDEDGNIIATFTTNNKMYYIVNTMKDHTFLLKDENQHIIKTFEIQGLLVIRANTSKVLILTKLIGNHSNRIDNVYSFSNDKIQLIQKNIYLGQYISGKYTIYENLNNIGSKRYSSVNIENGNSVKVKEKYPNIVWGNHVDNHYIIGATGDILHYIYYTEGMIKVLASYNPLTQKVVIYPIKSYEDIEFLRAGGDEIVVKVFGNKLNNNNERYYSLNKEEQIKGVTKDFQPVDLGKYAKGSPAPYYNTSVITINKLQFNQYSSDAYQHVVPPLF